MGERKLAYCTREDQIVTAATRNGERLRDIVLLLAEAGYARNKDSVRVRKIRLGLALHRTKADLAAIRQRHIDKLKQQNAKQVSKLLTSEDAAIRKRLIRGDAAFSQAMLKARASGTEAFVLGANPTPGTSRSYVPVTNPVSELPTASALTNLV